MPAAPKAATTGSPTFSPDAFFAAWTEERQKDPVPNNDLRTAIIQAFSLSQNDNYVYHAIASVTLQDVQKVIEHPGMIGKYGWYRDENGEPIHPGPPNSDSVAYTSLFNSSTASNKAFSNFTSNGKKGSIRAGVAQHLTPLRMIPSTLSIPRSKTHINPYLDFWRWSCHQVEWCGPNADTVNVKNSHHILPIFMHHFGCLCPSYESIEVMKSYARKRSIIDMGSGNGYWTYMLRRAGLTVAAVDNMQSLWRTTWIDDTIIEDGMKYIMKNNSGKDTVLLLVYPIVSADFTKQILNAYEGDTICIAGTQNANGYTAFKDVTVDQYFEKDMGGWEKVVQIPLPSFAGKDEALYIFERKIAAT